MRLKKLEKNETNLINLHARTRKAKVKTMIIVELCNFNSSKYQMSGPLMEKMKIAVNYNSTNNHSLNRFFCEKILFSPALYFSS